MSDRIAMLRLILESCLPTMIWSRQQTYPWCA